MYISDLSIKTELRTHKDFGSIAGLFQVKEDVLMYGFKGQLIQ